MKELPEITEVQRLTIKPGDVIVIRSPRRLSQEQMDQLGKLLPSRLSLPPGVKILVLDDGMSLEVAEKRLQ